MQSPNTSEAFKIVSDLAKTDSKVLEHLNIALDDVSEGQVKLKMQIRPSMTNSHGICHGGFIFALADTAFAYVIASKGASPVTLQASVSFIRAVRADETIFAIASLTKSGRRSSFGAVSVFNEEEKIIAQFQASGLQV